MTGLTWRRAGLYAVLGMGMGIATALFHWPWWRALHGGVIFALLLMLTEPRRN